MLIRQILNAKPAADIITISAKSSVSEAANLLSQNRIGALIVSETGQGVDGILSERDIVRELGKRGVSCMSDKVADVMTKKIITATPTETAESVLQSMTEKRFRHMPVTEDGKLLGVVSIGDIVSARLSEISTEKEALQDMIMGH